MVCLIAHASAPVVNLKICGKIPAIQLERCIMQKDST